jgi:hypothetical protein
MPTLTVRFAVVQEHQYGSGRKDALDMVSTSEQKLTNVQHSTCALYRHSRSISSHNLTPFLALWRLETWPAACRTSSRLCECRQARAERYG